MEGELKKHEPIVDDVGYSGRKQKRKQTGPFLDVRFPGRNSLTRWLDARSGLYRLSPAENILRLRVINLAICRRLLGSRASADSRIDANKALS